MILAFFVLANANRMNLDKSSVRNGFTLVELLVVIAIIALLASLLLPVLNKGELSGKRAVCINDLAQIGLAFHTFSNDHSGKFPMAVSTNEGGTLEYVQEGFESGSIFYTAYYQFQALSNELVFPRILVCPTDLRQAATNFAVLTNENLSYFVGVSATFDQPESILAGDRNISTNSYLQPTILQMGPLSSLWWTWEMHQQKGDVLFADGHVEQWNDASFNPNVNGYSGIQSFFLPTVLQMESAVAGGNAPSGSPASAPGNGGPGSSSGTAGANTGPGSAAASPASYPNAGVSPPASTQPSFSPAAARSQANASPRLPSGGNNSLNAKSATDESAAAPDVSSDADVGVDSPGEMSDFNSGLTKTLQHAGKWFFWLWLLLLLYLAYRLWKWFRKRDARLREQMRR